MGHARGWRTSLVVLVLVAATPAFVRADAGDIAAARDAYDRGAAAYDAGEFALAAVQLARADAMVANDVALELALKAAVRANDALLAMELAARADDRTSSTLVSAREDARAKVGSRVGRVTVTCPTEATCNASLDETPFPVGRARWVLVGQHRVVIGVPGGSRQAFQVRVDPGASVPVVAAVFPRDALPGTASRSPSPERPASRGGIAPAWFWVGTGLSAVLGGATVWSAIDTMNTHDEFSARPSAGLSNQGVDAQLRTNLLLAGTAAAVVATAVTGLVFVRWGGGARAATERTSSSGARLR